MQKNVLEEITKEFVDANWAIVKALEAKLIEAKRIAKINADEIEHLTHVESAARSYAIYLGFKQKR